MYTYIREFVVWATHYYFPGEMTANYAFQILMLGVCAGWLMGGCVVWLAMRKKKDHG